MQASVRPAAMEQENVVPGVKPAPAADVETKKKDNRTKEVKCPRVVVETYTCPKTNEQLSRSYVRGRPLGKGGFAVVYSMNDPSTGESFAAKVVAKSTLEKDRARQKILTEIRIHRQVSDRFLVKFKRCFEDTNNVYILMELCSDKTLADVVKRHKKLTELQAAPYMREVVAATAYLHRNKIIHRDLKLGNLFLTPAGLDEAWGDVTGPEGAEGGPGTDRELSECQFSTRLKIGDFGLACRLASDAEKKLTICGTPNYIAPEVLAGSKGGGHSYEVDVWSIGVILYALLVGTPPFQTSDVRATYKKIRAGAYEFPGDTSGGCTPGVSVDTAGGSIPGPGTRDCLPPGGSDGVGTGQTLTESIGKANSQTSLGKQSNTNPPVHATRLGKNAEHLIKWCLAPKPEHRPSLVEIASHPFMLVGAPEWRLRSELTVVHATGVGTSERTKSPLIRTESPLKAKASSESRSGSPFKTHATRAPLSPLPVNAKLRRNDGNGMGNRDAQRAKPVSPATPKSPPPSVPRAFDVLRDLHGDLFGGTQAPRRALEDGTTGADAVHAVPAAAPHPSSLSRPPGPIPLPVPSVASLNLDTSHSSLSASPELATRILGNTSPSPLGAAALGAALQKTTSGGGGGASTAAGDATTPEPCRASNPTFVSFPPIWVTKWVDYTSKYGLGYSLSDGTFGVVFNDQTKMTQSAEPFGVSGGAVCTSSQSESITGVNSGTSQAQNPKDGRARLEYRPRQRRTHNTNDGASVSCETLPCVFSTTNDAPPPHGLEKKAKLMRHFRGYLTRDGRSAVETSRGGVFPFGGVDGGGNGGETADGTNEPETYARAVEETAKSANEAKSPEEPRLPYVKNWLRTKHAILFRLSNRTIQVNFTDGSEILLSSVASAVVFWRPQKEEGGVGDSGSVRHRERSNASPSIHALASLPADPELLRRLRYVKEVLHQLVHRT